MVVCDLLVWLVSSRKENKVADKGFTFFMVVVGFAAFLIGPRFDLLEGASFFTAVVHGVSWFLFLGCFLSVAFDIQQTLKHKTGKGG